jgi:hypothetical protein
VFCSSLEQIKSRIGKDQSSLPSLFPMYTVAEQDVVIKKSSLLTMTSSYDNNCTPSPDDRCSQHRPRQRRSCRHFLFVSKPLGLESYAFPNDLVWRRIGTECRLSFTSPLDAGPTLLRRLRLRPPTSIYILLGSTHQLYVILLFDNFQSFLFSQFPPTSFSKFPSGAG